METELIKILTAIAACLISMVYLAYEIFTERKTTNIVKNKYMDYMRTTNDINVLNQELKKEVEILHDRLDDVSSLISITRAQCEQEKSEIARDCQSAYRLKQ